RLNEADGEEERLVLVLFQQLNRARGVPVVLVLFAITFECDDAVRLLVIDAQRWRRDRWSSWIGAAIPSRIVQVPHLSRRFCRTFKSAFRAAGLGRRGVPIGGDFLGVCAVRRVSRDAADRPRLGVVYPPINPLPIYPCVKELASAQGDVALLFEIFGQ